MYSRNLFLNTLSILHLDISTSRLSGSISATPYNPLLMIYALCPQWMFGSDVALSTPDKVPNHLQAEGVGDLPFIVLEVLMKCYVAALFILSISHFVYYG